MPIDEDHRLQAQSPYAATKVGADKLALSYQQSFDTPVVIARPFNTFGPRQTARAIIPTIVESATRLRPPNSEVERLVADRSKAQKLLDWQPLVEFDDRLQRTIDWMRGALDSYKAAIYNV